MPCLKLDGELPPLKLLILSEKEIGQQKFWGLPMGCEQIKGCSG